MRIVWELLFMLEGNTWYVPCAPPLNLFNESKWGLYNTVPFLVQQINFRYKTYLYFVNNENHSNTYKGQTEGVSCIERGQKLYGARTCDAIGLTETNEMTKSVIPPLSVKGCGWFCNVCISYKQFEYKCLILYFLPNNCCFVQ